MLEKNKYVEGIGRRKNAIARVRIYLGNSASIVNKKPIEEYFGSEDKLHVVFKPLKVTELEGKYYITALAKGGGVTGQLEAIQLGLARALYKMDPSLKSILRTNDLITRDPRMVESKKYNYKKARKKPQFSKR